jgi:hypothetical protein
MHTTVIICIHIPLLLLIGFDLNLDLSEMDAPLPDVTEMDAPVLEDGDELDKDDLPVEDADELDEEDVASILCAAVEYDLEDKLDGLIVLAVLELRGTFNALLIGT